MVETVDDPATLAQPVPAKFRGRPIFDAAKCIGCAGCANNCPAREILVHDVCQEIRIVQYLGRRCTYCGRCADVCPEKAITMSTEFENATNDIRDMQQRLELFMGTCQRCGRCFKNPTPLEQLMMKGYRLDLLEQERWVYDTKAGTHRKLTTFAGEDRNPVFTDNDKAFYYLSEESGSFNVRKMSLAGGKSQPVTSLSWAKKSTRMAG